MNILREKVSISRGGAIVFVLLLAGYEVWGRYKIRQSSILHPPSSKAIIWATGTLTDNALRTIERGLREDHIVVWRVQATPTPSPVPPPPEAVSQP